MVHEAHKSTAGVHLDDTGNRVVGGSQRSDGSVRRVVKVRPGFTPLEDTKRVNVREMRGVWTQDEPISCSRDVSKGTRAPKAFGGLESLLRANKARNEASQCSNRTRVTVVEHSGPDDLGVSEITKEFEGTGIENKPLEDESDRKILSSGGKEVQPKGQSTGGKRAPYRPPRATKEQLKR